MHPNPSNADDKRHDGMVFDEDNFVLAKPVDKRFPWILVQMTDTVRTLLGVPGKVDRYVYQPVPS